MRTLSLSLLAITAACSSGGGAGGPTPPLGQSESGRATYYAADGSGACGFDPSPNDLDVAAMDAPEWAGSAVCGECVQVTGPKGEVTVRIVDECPGCEPGHLDLSQEAFAKIADVSAGNVPITWQVVACAVQGPVQYHVKDGSSQWWTAIQVRNSRLPIAKLEYKTAATGYTDVARVDYELLRRRPGCRPRPVHGAHHLAERRGARGLAARRRRQHHGARRCPVSVASAQYPTQTMQPGWICANP